MTDNATTNGISARQAAEKAAQYLRELVQFAGPPSVEEVQTDDVEGSGNWLITLGFFPVGQSLLAGMGTKEYKQFKVDRMTGEVKWMRMRLA